MKGSKSEAKGNGGDAEAQLPSMSDWIFDARDIEGQNEAEENSGTASNENVESREAD